MFYTYASEEFLIPWENAKVNVNCIGNKTVYSVWCRISENKILYT